MTDESYRAIVERVVLRGRHGPYVVASSDDLEGSVTVSLESPVWQDSVVPERGMYLILSQVRKKRAGWRAFRGRLVQPSDEPNSKEQRAK